ncbi:imm11 family protein [Marinicellulosiphila megalodicopiae]|uniref:imm11 family protein n=1 Tax=Marinicellulosiphila megalodicopiae TaxID=2724896 RepID=UPI003BAEF898
MVNLDQYYVVHSENTKNYPMMNGEITPNIRSQCSGKYRDDNGDKILINNRIEIELAPEDYSYHINLAFPKPNKPEYVDFHMYDLEQSVSNKFVEAFEGFPGVQFLQGTEGEVINELKLDYYLVHYLQAIKCMDMEKSKVKTSKSGRIISYEKLVLNYEVLNNIPEDQRLIFWLWERPSTRIVHQKFVDIYNEAGLKGARFVPIEQYNEETAFM